MKYANGLEKYYRVPWNAFERVHREFTDYKIMIFDYFEQETFLPCAVFDWDVKQENMMWHHVATEYWQDIWYRQDIFIQCKLLRKQCTINSLPHVVLFVLSMLNLAFTHLTVWGIQNKMREFVFLVHQGAKTEIWPAYILPGYLIYHFYTDRWLWYTSLLGYKLINLCSWLAVCGCIL